MPSSGGKAVGLVLVVPKEGPVACATSHRMCVNVIKR